MKRQSRKLLHFVNMCKNKEYYYSLELNNNSRNEQKNYDLIRYTKIYEDLVNKTGWDIDTLKSILTAAKHLGWIETKDEETRDGQDYIYFFRCSISTDGFKELYRPTLDTIIEDFRHWFKLTAFVSAFIFGILSTSLGFMNYNLNKERSVAPAVTILQTTP